MVDALERLQRPSEFQDSESYHDYAVTIRGGRDRGGKEGGAWDLVFSGFTGVRSLFSICLC